MTQRCPLLRLRRRLPDHKHAIKPAKSGRGDVRDHFGRESMSMRSISMRRRVRLLRYSALAATMLSLPITAHAQADQGEDQPESTENEALAAESEDVIVVTGTSIRGVPPTGSDLITVTSEDVSRSARRARPNCSRPCRSSTASTPRRASAMAGSVPSRLVFGAYPQPLHCH